MFFRSLPVCRFVTDARLKQPSPAETAFQPLGHHSVALYMIPKLLASNSAPVTRMRFALYGRSQAADFNYSIVDTVFVSRRTIVRFQAESHIFPSHSLTLSGQTYSHDISAGEAQSGNS
jgi:hypothetical protein